MRIFIHIYSQTLLFVDKKSAVTVNNNGTLSPWFYAEKIDYLGNYKEIRLK